MAVTPVWCEVEARQKSGSYTARNRVRVNWRARLCEQLGQMQIELIQSVPALLLDLPLRLSGVASMCALLDEALPEREAQPGLYDGSVALLDVIRSR